MTNAAILIINLIVIFLGVLVLWFGYKKDKAENPQAVKKLTKRIFIFGVIIAILLVTLVVTQKKNIRRCFPNTRDEFDYDNI